MCAVSGSCEGTDDGTGDEVDTFIAVGGCLPAVIEVKVHQANDIYVVRQRLTTNVHTAVNINYYNSQVTPHQKMSVFKSLNFPNTQESLVQIHCSFLT